MHLSVFYISQNKQRSLPYTTLFIEFIKKKKKFVYCAVRSEFRGEFPNKIFVFKAVPWFKRIVSGPSSRRTKFDPSSYYYSCCNIVRQ